MIGIRRPRRRHDSQRNDGHERETTPPPAITLSKGIDVRHDVVEYCGRQQIPVARK
jgi:hypothetical protein